MRKKHKQIKKKSNKALFLDKIWFYTTSFIWGFLPSIGIVLISILNTKLLVSIFPNFNYNFHPISLGIYAFASIAVFFISSPKAKVFRKNFFVSTIINLIVFFIIGKVPVN